jgi:hypothetical protein
MDKYRDPRGTRRKVIQVAEDPNGGLTRVSFECGHTSELNQIYHYEVGSELHCFKCQD